MGTIRYIGSKARIVSFILDSIGLPSNEKMRFVDFFSGTGAVSREAALRGWTVRANDHLISSAILTTAQLLCLDDVPFSSFGGYDSALLALGSAKPVEGFVFREYTPSGASKSGHARYYFTEDNGSRIDGMRRVIASWRAARQISDSEEKLLIADLMAAANSVANIAGTYGCFLRQWSPSARNPIRISRRTLLDKKCIFDVSCTDAFQIETKSTDVAYLDPPYTKRQYAAYYHILETIAAGDAPNVGGVTGLRPWEHKASPFCYKTRALKSLACLVEQCQASRIFISYSSEGHIEIDDLKSAMSKYRHVRIHAAGNISRYAPNQAARDRPEAVTEHIIEVHKNCLEGAIA
jgi:adenine-specific DNA-methyltransferase